MGVEGGRGHGAAEQQEARQVQEPGLRGEVVKNPSWEGEKEQTLAGRRTEVPSPWWEAPSGCFPVPWGSLYKRRFKGKMTENFKRMLGSIKSQAESPLLGAEPNTVAP